MFGKLFDWAYRLLVDRLARRIAADIATASGEPVIPEPALLLGHDGNSKPAESKPRGRQRAKKG